MNYEKSFKKAIELRYSYSDDCKLCHFHPPNQLDMAQSVNVPPLDCSGMKSWPHGSSLINYMKLTEFRYT